MADTTPGGRYLVAGQWVDANGRPLPAPEKPVTPTETPALLAPTVPVTPTPTVVPVKARG